MSVDKYPQASLDSKTQAMIEAGKAIREAGGLAVAEAGRVERILDQAGGADYKADPSGHRELAEQGFVSYVSPEERVVRRQLQALKDKNLPKISTSQIAGQRNASRALRDFQL